MALVDGDNGATDGARSSSAKRMATVEALQACAIDAYFASNSLVKHQIDSYNDFLLRKLDEIIEGFNPIEVVHLYLPDVESFRYKLRLDVMNPVLSKPIIYEKDGSTKVMTPNDARLRNFTYAVPLCVDIKVTTECFDDQSQQYVTDVKKLNNISIGKVPLMVRSKYCMLNANVHEDHIDECGYDPGGYFIINGNEKVIISQDRICENKTFVFTNTKGTTSYSHVAEIRSVAEHRFGVPKTASLKLSSKENQFGKPIRVTLHHIKHDVPLFVIFKALGIESDKSILSYIVHDLKDPNNDAIVKELVASINEAGDVQCTHDALEYLSRYLQINGYHKEILNNKHHRLEIVRSVLVNEFLPHVGPDAKKKALYLGYMTKKLVCCYLGVWKMDDRDSYINKRVDTPGVLMANLFRQYYGKMIKDTKIMIQKDINNGPWKATGQFSNIITKVNVYKIIKSTVIESGMKYALATGNWGIKSNKNKQGVAQVLNRMTYNATVSHLRRVNTPLEKSGKLIQPRKLHSTQFGFICPSECFDPETPILMWDGTIKEAQKIVVGDYLIDDNGNAVRVKSTCEGFKDMYEIVPDKRNFMSYTVTDNHILTLKVRNYVRNYGKKKQITWFDKNEMRYTSKYIDNEDDAVKIRASLDDDDVIDITIEKYLALPENVRKNLYLFKSDGINWDHKEVALDPYILGMWLGDGMSTGYGFATADMELRDKWIEWGGRNDATITKGVRYKYNIGSTINKTQHGLNCNKSEAAPLKKLLAKYGLIKNKHIPMDYLVNDRATRLAVLAGLVDTDGSVRANGHEIRICQGERNYRILHDAEFLAQSLGFSCHVSDGVSTYSVNGEQRNKPYKELTITGARLFEVPTVLPRKKLNEFDNPTSVRKCSSYLQSTFRLIKKDVQPYVGWQLEGSGRFLLGDMSTSHNTPEGSSIGLVKNLSMIAFISVSSNAAHVREIVFSDAATIAFDGKNIGVFHGNTTLHLNGDIIGVHTDPPALFARLKQLKRTGVISVYTSIVWDIFNSEIRINCEGGRLLRPLFTVAGLSDIESDVVTDVFKRLDWNRLVASGAIEYLDVEESNASMIAMRYADLHKGDKGANKRPKYTHVEIHPSLMLGALAGSIPFSDHNQAPRNTYQSAMGKQAIGVYATNFRHRFDTMSHVLNYPQKPLVETKISKLVNTDSMPSGVNVIVAIMCMTGFNQEDSIIMNKSAVDRGLFSSTFYRTYKEQNNRNHSNGEEEFFMKPHPERTIGMKPFNYDKVANDGFVPENTFVDSGDIIIGKCMPQKKDSVIVYKDTSVALKNNESGFVDKNCYGDKHFTNINGDGYTFTKVRIRNTRVPSIGDKFSCYSPDHEILTTSGWVRFDALTVDHEVATLVEGTLMYQRPSEVQRYPYMGPMYCVKNGSIDLLVTPNHRMYVRSMWSRDSVKPTYETPQAMDIFGQSRFYKRDVDAWMPGRDDAHFEYAGADIVGFRSGASGGRTFPIEPWLEFVGAWITGNFVRTANFVALVTPQQGILGRLVDELELHAYYDGQLGAWIVLDPEVVEFGATIESDRASRHLPDWAFSLTRKAADGMVRALAGQSKSFDTDSAHVRDQFQRLCLHAGCACYWVLATPEYREFRDLPDVGDVWRCVLSVGDENEPQVNRGRQKRETWEPYNGTVHCCTVPKGEGVVYVRRMGLPVWCGQSKHGQKGTIGMVYRCEDMPYTKDGLVPDIIVNPHAIPSRMTIAQLMECLMSKACVMEGAYGDATPFNDASVEQIADALERYGCDRYGNEVMYNPRTGEQMDTEIFIGPTFYQRLKHMTCDKVHSRSNAGPIVLLTRQPAEGRAREGGLRIGEMEEEVILAHGSTSFMKERFLECSDNYRVHVCTQCGMMANVNPEKGIYGCRPCKNNTHFAEIRIPYAAKLLFQEMQVMGIGTKFITSSSSA